MDMDTNEITINRIIGFERVEAGTDLEDEMPTPVLSPTQIVVPAIPPAGTADPFGRGDSFDLAKVMCDVSVIPSLISPLQDVEVPPCSNAAEYAAPAFETVLESPGYTVPEESGFMWIPGFVPVSEVVLDEEGGYLRSLEEPLPPQAVRTAIAPLVTDLIMPTVPPTPDEDTTVPVTEGARKTERAQMFVVEDTEGSPSSEMCADANDVGPDISREGPFDACEADHEPGQSPLVLRQHVGMPVQDDVIRRPC